MLALGLLGAYAWHAKQVAYPLLRLRLLRIRTFRVSALGGFVTRLGIGGMPLMLPLLFQLGVGLPAWQSGLLMMPSALAAMLMKVISVWMLRRFGYRKVLIVNTVMVASSISTFSLVNSGTPLIAVVALDLFMGLFNSLEFSSMNSMAYADVVEADASMASTMAPTLQQMSMSFGLASASLITGFFLSKLPQTGAAAVSGALHHAFLALGAITLLSSLSFWRLRPSDAQNLSQYVSAAEGR
jgi:MFS family permease